MLNLDCVIAMLMPDDSAALLTQLALRPHSCETARARIQSHVRVGVLLVMRSLMRYEGLESVSHLQFEHLQGAARSQVQKVVLLLVGYVVLW